jgi:carbamoyl-phosphate synthase large subunit
MKLDLVKPKKNVTLLLTSAGGLTGVYLSKHYKKNSNYRIIGVDISDLNPLKKWVDVFYKVPAIKDSNFLSVIRDIIDKEKIDILIPLTSYDIDFFSKPIVQNELRETKLLTMDYTDHIILHDKKSCYQYLKNLGINTPIIYTRKTDINYPCIIKPRRSSGSKDTVVLYDDNDFEYWSKKIEDSIIIQYLEGSEYTADCLFDETGRCLGANVRERIKTRGGGATIARVDNSIKIDKIIKKLENTSKIKGPVNFQFKILPNAELCVFDFNTRFASGGLALTVESGFDIPNLLIQILLKEKVIKWEPKPENDGLTMVRFYDEYFMYDYE